MIAAVESEYANTDDLNRQLSTAFNRLKQSLPAIEVPKVYTQISALDQSIVVGNGTIGISLDKYLGPVILCMQNIIRRLSASRCRASISSRTV